MYNLQTFTNLGVIGHQPRYAIKILDEALRLYEHFMQLPKPILQAFFCPSMLTHMAMHTQLEGVYGQKSERTKFASWRGTFGQKKLCMHLNLYKCI